MSIDRASTGALRTDKTEQTKARLTPGSLWAGGGQLLTLDDGRPPHADQLSKTFGRLADLRLPRIFLHDLRQTGATLGLRAVRCPNPNVKCDLLEHAPVGALRPYSHLVPSLDRDAADAVVWLIDFEPNSSAGTVDEAGAESS